MKRLCLVLGAVALLAALVPAGASAERTLDKGSFFLVGAGNFTISAFYGDTQLGRGLKFSRG
jgi:hypothetical protein